MATLQVTRDPQNQHIPSSSAPSLSPLSIPSPCSRAASTVPRLDYAPRRASSTPPALFTSLESKGRMAAMISSCPYKAGDSDFIASTMDHGEIALGRRHISKLHERRQSMPVSTDARSLGDLPLERDKRRKSLASRGQSIHSSATQNKFPVVDVPQFVSEPMMNTLRTKDQRTLGEGNLADKETLASSHTLTPNADHVIGGRRASIRSQQLALLASQARIVSSGSSNVKTAKKAEAAVKDVVQKAVDQRRSSLSVKGLLYDSEEQNKFSNSIEGSMDESPAESSTKAKASVETLRDPSKVWGNVLEQPEMASAFMQGASELANDWANRFYAYERNWAGDAIRREKRRFSKLDGEDQRQEFRQQVEKDAAKRGKNESDSATPSSPSQKTGRVRLPDVVITASTATTPTVAAAVSTETTYSPLSRPSMDVTPVPQSECSSGPASPLQTGIELTNKVSPRPSLKISESTSSTVSSGSLVGVLNEFASLLETRQETCQGLEKLARDAKELAGTRLKPVRGKALSTDDEKEQEKESNVKNEDMDGDDSFEDPL